MDIDPSVQMFNQQKTACGTILKSALREREQERQNEIELVERGVT